MSILNNEQIEQYKAIQHGLVAKANEEQLLELASDHFDCLDDLKGSRDKDDLRAKANVKETLELILLRSIELNAK